jgi:hypothetical protein
MLPVGKEPPGTHCTGPGVQSRPVPEDGWKIFRRRESNLGRSDRSLVPILTDLTVRVHAVSRCIFYTVFVPREKNIKYHVAFLKQSLQFQSGCLTTKPGVANRKSASTSVPVEVFSSTREKFYLAVDGEAFLSVLTPCGFLYFRKGWKQTKIFA